MANLPARIDSETQLEEIMATPSPELVEAMSRLDGDLIILGVAGKMGPTLGRLARRAFDRAGSKSQVIGVARFSTPGTREKLESTGIKTIKADLLNRNELAELPDVPNVIFMAGRKFGTTGDQSLTWAMNTYMPALVADRYRDARIVALSTGNVYPLTPVDGKGPNEDHPTAPVGEYAQSCLGRERMFEYVSRQNHTPMALIRLNYAIDLRYGVLLDVASKVYADQTIDLAMGYANVIWQGDANAAILRSLRYCTSPPRILNLTGPEIISIRQVANDFGQRFGKAPLFEGNEDPTALLSDASQYVDLLGGPAVTLEKMIDWVAHWVKIDGPTLDKPTHYEARDGSF